MGTRSLESITLKLQMEATVKNLMSDQLAATGRVSLSYAPTITSGLTAGKANRAFQLKHVTTYSDRTIANGSYVIISLYDLLGDDPQDLGAGYGNDIVGQELSNEEVVAIAIVNENAVGVAGYLEVKPASTAGWSPIGVHTVALGGALLGQGLILKTQLAEAGFAITPGDAGSHRIRLEASGGDVKYSLYAFTRSDSDESSGSSGSSQSSSLSSSLSSSSSSSVSSSSRSTSSSSFSVSTSSASSNSSSSSSSSSPSSQSSSPSSVSVSASSASSNSNSSSSSVSSSSSSSHSSSSQS